MMLDIYRSDCVTIGKDVTVHTPTENLQGRAVDVDSDGALVVRFSDGNIRSVQAGEVSVRGLYGYC
jgi:BirA family biotin operon repressor/biotin-[acetyl-CoA-carboxylase] ligase